MAKASLTSHCTEAARALLLPILREGGSVNSAVMRSVVDSL